jgi:hypothetical protein
MSLPLPRPPPPPSPALSCPLLPLPCPRPPPPPTTKGACYGKVRTMSDGTGITPEAAGPSIAVQMVGLNGVPQAGDEFQVRKGGG